MRTLLSALVVLFIPYALIGCDAKTENSTLPSPKPKIDRAKLERMLTPGPLADTDKEKEVERIVDQMDKIISSDMEKIEVSLLPLREVGPSVNSTMYQYIDDKNDALHSIHIYDFPDGTDTRDKLGVAMCHIFTELTKSGAKTTNHQLLLDTSTLGEASKAVWGMDASRPFVKFCFGGAKGKAALIQIFSHSMSDGIKAYERLQRLKHF